MGFSKFVTKLFMLIFAVLLITFSYVVLFLLQQNVDLALSSSSSPSSLPPIPPPSPPLSLPPSTYPLK
jgi:hypothetical protein